MIYRLANYRQAFSGLNLSFQYFTASRCTKTSTKPRQMFECCSNVTRQNIVLLFFQQIENCILTVKIKCPNSLK